MLSALRGFTFHVMAAGLVFVHASTAQPVHAAALTLEKKIPLGKVSGRIDHFALDREGHRLFLAELGNDTVSVIDVRAGTVVHRLTGLKEPQGVGYAAGSLFVANANDGAVHVFNGTDFAPVATIDLKDDADNIRVDSANALVFVGYGAGGLAVIDAKTFTKKAQLGLKDHPESFQLDPVQNRAFVNVPDAHEIAVLDRASGKQVASWGAPGLRANFPMAVRSDGTRILAAYRSPARLAMLDTTNGNVLANVPTCGDADDVFIDEKRGRAYVSCGEGAIDILDVTATALTPAARTQTVRGARTAFFDPDMDRLFVAVRASLSEAPAVWVFKPE